MSANSSKLLPNSKAKPDRVSSAKHPVQQLNKKPNFELKTSHSMQAFTKFRLNEKLSSSSQINAMQRNQEMMFQKLKARHWNSIK